MNSAQDTDPAKQRNELGTTYAVIGGMLGALTSILALVQVFTTDNALIITLLLAAVLGLAVTVIRDTWHSRGPRRRLGSLMVVAALVLASFSSGYGLGTAAAPRTEPSMAAPQTSADTKSDTASPVVGPRDGTTAVPTTAPPVGALLFTNVEPATTRMGTWGFNSWKVGSVSVETIVYDEAIVVVLIDCYTHGTRFAEYVIGRKYHRLTGKLALADNSQLTAPVPMTIVLDDTTKVRKSVTTTPLELNVDLVGVNRIRFEFTTPGSGCTAYSTLAFLNLTAEP